MGAPSKKARKIRAATEFDAKRLASEIAYPRNTQGAVFSWTLADIALARDAQMRGQFLLAARMAESMRTDDALAVAYENRLDPQRCIPVKLEPSKGARAVSICGEADALFGEEGIGVRPETLADVNGCLVNHGVAFGINVATPRDDGSRVDFEMRYWPIEFVRWDPFRKIFIARVDLATVPQDVLEREIKSDEDLVAPGPLGAYEIPIVHGDGRWVIFSKHEHEPWKQEAAIMPAALVWARHAYAVRDWAKGSVAHGNAKIVGELPEGMALQSAEGALTSDAAAFVELLRGLASSDQPIGIRPAGSKTDYIVNNSTAWQVWDELVQNAEKAAARIYLGTDGTLGTQGGAPGVDIASLFGVATTKIEGDLRAIERGIQTGVIEPWCAMNFGDSSLAPKRCYQIPSQDEEKAADAFAKRNSAFWLNVKAAHDSGIVLDQNYINALAEEYRVPAPVLPAGGMLLTPPVAGGDPKPKPMNGATPLSESIDDLVQMLDQSRAADGKFGSGGGGAKKHEKQKANPNNPDVSTMPVLGEGANRKVYDAGDGTVIKVAKNAQARKDNRLEAESSGKDPLLAEITDHGEKYAWVKQEKTSPVSSDDLAKEFGVSASDAKKKYDVVIRDPFGIETKVTGKDWLFAAVHSANGTNATDSYLGGDRVKSAGKLEAALKRLKGNVPGIDLTDLAFPGQWGKSGSGHVKIVDYGFSGV